MGFGGEGFLGKSPKFTLGIFGSEGMVKTSTGGDLGLTGGLTRFTSISEAPLDLGRLCPPATDFVDISTSSELNEPSAFGGSTDHDEAGVVVVFCEKSQSYNEPGCVEGSDSGSMSTMFFIQYHTFLGTRHHVLSLTRECRTIQAQYQLKLGEVTN